MNQLIEQLKEASKRLSEANARVMLANFSTEDFECNEKIESKFEAIKKSN
jgi:hypothetical protein